MLQLNLILVQFDIPKWHKIVCTDVFNELIELWDENVYENQVGSTNVHDAGGGSEWIMKVLPKVLCKVGQSLTDCQKNSPTVITESKSVFTLPAKFESKIKRPEDPNTSKKDDSATIVVDSQP